MRNVPIIDYISTLDKIDDSDCLPSLELNVLVKAHEILGEAKKCCQNENFEFLFFIISRFREIVNNIPLLEKLFEKEYNWIWQNLNDEISQILNCLFGKYSKKRKCAEDHGTKGNCKADMKIASKILRVILVQPLPLYDDKERLGHDVVELINSKFEFLLEIKPEKQKIVESFEKILKESSFQDEESIRQEFENIKVVEESEIQALVWYSLALNSYRTSNHEDCKKYSQLYLTSIDSTYDDRLRSSAWAILAHEHVRQLFQLDKNAIFNEWRWRILPFKMAISAQPNEAVIHFEVAATMYQLASQLIRFVRQLPLDDLRRKRIKDGSILREYSRYHFDKCLQLAQPSLDGTPAEFNWLCYFFIGKLAGKQNDDIVKVVEYFYEAACGCQLAGFYYPVKINSKKQTNFEPLEVHYQAHSAVWKYLDRNDNPPLNTLLQLESYLKVFANGHKVVKYSNSLFDTPPELYLTVSELVENVAGSEIEKEEERVCQEILTKLEVIEKLKTMCQSAFLLICERFPHIKSHYRLAEWYLENGKFELASEQILKNVFKRKKRDDGVFDNIIEISCNDINRAGSFCFHVERCLRVAIYITTKMLDVHNLASILISLISTIALDDDQFIEPRSNVKLIRSVLESIETVCLTVRPRSSRNTPSPPPQEISQDSSKNEPTKVIHVTPAMIRNELWRIWNAFLKRDKKSENEKLLAFAEKRISALITKIYGSIQILRTKVLQKESTSNNSAENLPRKTKNVLKRKAQANALDVIQPFLKKTALSSIPSTSAQIAQDDDDIQCLDPPVVTVNQQLAHTWNTIMQQLYSKK
ncbi:unnamed protein product [Caenorhabditis angaria]|uniref:Uncharacterized protein n=1 Tax=Caenorhabditis angaria TaxID=860376 RepID=A0A9P1IRV0_9PELO|nr:unnamed protein product [Caenorhabditis angaria]